MDTTAGREILAALIAAPRPQATAAMARLEAEDFPLWQHKRIFEALGHVSFAQHQEPGAILVQVNDWLLQAGHYQDSDNGLRAEVSALVSTAGYPDILPHLVDAAISSRWRIDAQAYAERIIQHINSPDSDLVAALAGLEAVRIQYARLQATQAPKTIRAA